MDSLSRQFGEENATKEPTEEQECAIKEAQSNVGHRGIETTQYELLKAYTKWKYQKEHIKKYIENCEICVRNKVKHKGEEEFVTTNNKLEVFGVDILEVQENYILIGIDYFTRRARGKFVKTKQAGTVVKVLKEWFSKIGMPKKIISDQGKEFNNKHVANFCAENNIEHHITSTEHAEGNGRVERLNRTLRDLLRKKDNPTITQKLVIDIIEKYNNSMHSAIQATPNEAWNDKPKIVEDRKKYERICQKI